jgi:hypothetical protein
MTTYDLFLCWIIAMLLVLVVGEASIHAGRVDRGHHHDYAARRTARARHTQGKLP